MLGNALVPQVPSSRRAGSLVLGSLAAVLVSVPIAAAMMMSQPSKPALETCAVPVDANALSPRDRGFLARRIIACTDHERGTITNAEYVRRITAIDAAWAATPPAPPPPMQWAATVRDVSSQYSTGSWAATKVLGAPDVFPSQGDNAQAWASLGADDRAEWIEVGYDQPMPISAVEIYETFNPGAVDRVELITASGQRIEAYADKAGARGPTARKQRVDVACTAEPIVAVRVHLDSVAVAGWNELDAIGVAPCAQQ